MFNKLRIEQKRKSILSLMLSAVMAVSLLPLSTGTAFAAESPALQKGIGDLADGEHLYMGIQGSDLIGAGTEIKWRVLDKDKTNTDDTNGVLLLSEEGLGSGTDGDVYFDNTSPKKNKWQGSDAQTWCKEFSGETSGGKTSLHANELNALLATTKTDEEYTSKQYSMKFAKVENILNADKVFFLSAEEVDSTYFNGGIAGNSERIAKYNGEAKPCWLRSPDDGSTSDAGLVNFDGSVYYHYVDNAWAARPACNLDKGKVVFIAPAEGGKQSATTGITELKTVGTTSTAEWKLTLKEDARNSFSASKTGQTGMNVQINYTDAITGTNEYLSAIVTDSTENTIKFYGRIKALTGAGDANGIVEIDLSGNFASGDKLFVFNEQMNGDKKTDYSSDLQEITGITAGTPKTLSAISITTAPNKTTYTQGESFDKTGMKVTATYSDSSTAELADDAYTYTPAGALTTSDHTITVSYTEGSETKTAIQAITVNPVSIPATITSVVVAPKTATIKQGKTQTFHATVNGTGSYDNIVTWSISGKTSASTNITSDGILSIANDETIGSLITVTATANGDSTKKDTANITVTKKTSSGSSGSGGGSSTSNYAIEKEKTENGSIKVDSEAKEGETVTVTAEPDKGYELHTLTVTDKKGNEIKLTRKSDTKYTFLMPNKKVMVGATFKKTEPNIVPIINPNNNTKDKQPTIETRTTIFTIGSNLMKQIIKGKDKASEGQRQMDAKPFIHQGRTMVPLRFVAESLGMKVEWNQKMKTVTLKDRDSIVSIPINSNKIIVTKANGETKEYTSDVKPIVKEGRTYLTISNIGKTIGAEMTWNNTTKQITVTKQVMIEE